jgi:hypothetical protein
MKGISLVFTSLLFVFGCMGLIFVSTSFSAEDPMTKDVQSAVDDFVEGCREELNAYCKDVTPGEGRVLSCLYAFQDKVSPKCESAIYNSLEQLQKTVNDLIYAVNKCQADLQIHCNDIEPGEGRLLECLNSYEDKISASCNQALIDIGYK